MGMLATLIAGLASGEAATALRRARLAAVAYFFAGVSALVGAGFLVGALHIWVARRYGSLEAALGVGIGFLIVACLILLAFRLSAGSRARQRQRRRRTDYTALGFSAALALLPALARGKGGLAGILGPAAALVAYAIYREHARTGQRDPDADADT